MGPERVRIECRAVWAQRGSELNARLCGSREDQNLVQGCVGPERVRTECRAEWAQRGSELNAGLRGSREDQN